MRISMRPPGAARRCRGSACSLPIRSSPPHRTASLVRTRARTMAAEAWLTRAAGEIWAGLGDAADRDLLTLARFGLGVRPVEIPSLTLDAVREWLLRRAPDMRIEGADRELQGCLVLPHGQAYIFLDARDPVAERR